MERTMEFKRPPAYLFRLVLMLVIVASLTEIVRLTRSVRADASFTPCNLVVYRVGTGSGSLLNSGNAVFLDEYTPAGTLVQSIPLPATASGSNHQLIASGTATSEG